MSEHRTVTISLSPELAAQLDAVARAEGRSRSELFREAARQYLRRHQRWDRIYAYGEDAAGRAGVADEDAVAVAVTAHRRAGRRTH